MTLQADGIACVPSLGRIARPRLSAFQTPPATLGPSPRPLVSKARLAVSDPRLSKRTPETTPALTDWLHHGGIPGGLLRSFGLLRVLGRHFRLSLDRGVNGIVVPIEEKRFVLMFLDERACFYRFPI